MMLPYKFSPFLFLRSPAYSIDNFELTGLQQILADRFFRTALYFASPSLYKRVKSKNFEASQLTKSSVESLMKYYNRMSYRSTPFGMFSAFSDTKWGEDNELSFSGNDRVHIQVDYRLSQILSKDAIAVTTPDTFYSNSSIYALGKELRYIKAGRNGDTAEHMQGISVVDNSRFLSRLISMSKNGIGLTQLKELLSSGYPAEDPEELLNELQGEELLFSSLVPNVTGPNYLNRLGELLADEHILSLIKKLESSRDPASVDVMELDKLIEPFLNKSEAIRSSFYVNYEREVTGAVNIVYQEKLLRGLHCLSKLQQDGEIGAISRFKKKFIERFEEREVLLMVALDPEAGVGYEYLEETADDGELLTGISFKETDAFKKISWGPVQEMLMNKMSFPGERYAIVITDEDLDSLPVKTRPLSPGISVMFSVCGDQVLIETAGGATATALIGRFTNVSNKVLSHARTLADAEQQANPDVLFAEIAYSSEEHAANINTRAHIRDHEIPILVHSTLANKQVIGLNDLYVSVQQNEIILRSAKLTQRIVPRASTAYNHIRSELPVFRFLSDLQYQGIESGFAIHPEELLPGRVFYPRIEYKDCILSRATWVLGKHELRKIKDVPTFLGVAKELGIRRYFALSESDKQLVFDLHNPEGLNLFLAQLKNAERVMLREFFRETTSDALLKDAKGKIYSHQLIAYLLNPSRVYVPVPQQAKNKKHTKRYVFPGEDWIYLKIYCSSQNANNILLKIYPIIRQYAAVIDKWFFVRYNDPEHHLRIRICADKGLIRELPAMFNSRLRAFTVSALVSRVQIDTYAREVERYGPETIELAEQVFCSSSELVVTYFQRDRDEAQTIRFALISTHELLLAFNLDIESRRALLEKISVSMMNEHSNRKQLRDDLNKKYREHQQMVQEIMRAGSAVFSSRERLKLNLLITKIRKFNHAVISTRALRIDQAVSDVLHMHMNRIFSSEQRKKELVIYYMCLRFYISDKARVLSGLA